MRKDSAITVFATGSNITTGAASASTTIPLSSSGVKPNYIRVTSTLPAYVKLGITAATAVAGDTMVQPADAVILSVGGSTHIAALQVAAAGIVNIVPLDDVS